MTRDRRFVAAHRGGPGMVSGEITVGAAREAAFAAHAAAREASDDAARAAARAAGQAVSTPHMADHSLGPAYYAVKAMRLASPPSDAEAAGEREQEWQRAHVPEPVRGLVLPALEQGSVLGKLQPHPLRRPRR